MIYKLGVAWQDTRKHPTLMTDEIEAETFEEAKEKFLADSLVSGHALNDLVLLLHTKQDL